MAFDGSGFLALSFLRWLLVELATTKLREDAGFFAGTLEPPQSGVKILVFPNFDLRH